MEVAHVSRNGLRLLSTDSDIVEDVSSLLTVAGAEVFAFSSWEEYARLQQGDVVVEMCVVDPVFRIC